MNEARLLPFAAGLGAIAGLRSFSAPLTLSRASRIRALDLTGTPLSLIGKANGAHVAVALALGELIADKLPFTPSRTKPPSLVARFLSGAIAGASVARARKTAWIGAAALGGAAAIAASYAGYQLRHSVVNATKLPDPVIAVLEDALVIGSGLALVAALKRTE